MEFVLYLLAGLALIGIPVFLAPVELRVSYGREGEKDLLNMDLSFWRLLKYRYQVDMVDINASLPQVVLRYRSSLKKGSGKVVSRERKKIKPPGILELYRQLSFWRDIYGLVKPSANYFKSRARITCLLWKTKFGLGDPYSTGMATGVIWSLKGFLVSFLCSQVKVASVPVLAVVPDFSGACLMVRLDCRLATRAGYIVLAGFRALAALLFSGRIPEIIRMSKKKKARQNKEKR